MKNKYRIWDKEENKYVYHEDLVCHKGLGLKDKNWKEIYEGDIVKTVDDHPSTLNIKHVEYSKGVITWLCEGFKVCQSYIGTTWLGTYASCHCCPCGLEVIGNVFENPELP